MAKSFIIRQIFIVMQYPVCLSFLNHPAVTGIVGTASSGKAISYVQFLHATSEGNPHLVFIVLPPLHRIAIIISAI